MALKREHRLLGVPQVPQVQTWVSAAGYQHVLTGWVPPHTVDTAIMSPLNNVSAAIAVSGVNDFDAPACHLHVLAHVTHGLACIPQSSVASCAVRNQTPGRRN